MYEDPRLPIRFWVKVYPEPNTGCWLWGNGLTADGYGSYAHQGTGRTAHRVSYETLVGPVPAGLQIDHLCRVRSCVNPEHMEPVTASMNTRRGNGPAGKNSRKIKCDSGHELSGTNLRIRGNRRACGICESRRTREYLERRWK